MGSPCYYFPHTSCISFLIWHTLIIFISSFLYCNLPNYSLSSIISTFFVLTQHWHLINMCKSYENACHISCIQILSLLAVQFGSLYQSTTYFLAYLSNHPCISWHTGIRSTALLLPTSHCINPRGQSEVSQWTNKWSKRHLPLYMPCHPFHYWIFNLFPSTDLPSHSVITLSPSNQHASHKAQMAHTLATAQTKPERNHMTKGWSNHRACSSAQPML